MNGSVLLDTNVVIALFGGEQNVRDELRHADSVFVPSVVVGELFYGARRSGRVEKNLARVEEFVASNSVLNCDTETARHYSRIKESLRTKGRPIPENDVWIAAIARQHSLTLISRDTHFAEVDQLTLERW